MGYVIIWYLLNGCILCTLWYVGNYELFSMSKHGIQGFQLFLQLNLLVLKWTGKKNYGVKSLYHILYEEDIDFIEHDMLVQLSCLVVHFFLICKEQIKLVIHYVRYFILCSYQKKCSE